MWQVIILVGMLLAPAPAWAQACSGISDPAARLNCYARQRTAPAARSVPVAPPELGGNCTAANPCVGPRGGRYYFTPSGTKRYLGR
ncbi:hypothetical protein KTR66_04620 [Roseococcus sp. SDR]|uniref:hypothetical protein n=1 Tax=Roseococcus sp. SDR TaxID=2835532 RepID=UPI001BCFE406|nr:hypothetical protein [Roseococcus sp. SDR]MBS7789263.1 hypothetical protein [Roseococcus sp. SDR]MBV1844577.1 hypothetical protein [Roseococcus sp. SDR]